MIPVDEALNRILSATAALGIEACALSDSLGRVLAEPAVATLDLPRFDQSAVDGYAVCESDIAGAPCRLLVSGAVAAAARDAAPRLQARTAMRIFTGGWLPEGADTVVRQELTERDGDAVHIFKTLEPGTDIRRQGEELREHDVVAAAGQRITPGLLGAIAMAGVHRVAVYHKPRVAVLITGDEVAPPGVPLQPGQVPDANGPLLLAYLRSWGYADVEPQYVEDRFEAVCQALNSALTRCEVVLTTGGVSVGDHDHVPSAAQSQGAETLLWKVAQKPGMPLYVARRGHSQLFGLPGNPASVLVNLLVYVRPALERLSGLPGDAPTPWQRGRLTADIRAEKEKTLWLRMRRRMDDDGQVLLEPLGRQASHMLSNLAQAQVLARIPPASGWPAGAVVEWLPLAG